MNQQEGYKFVSFKDYCPICRYKDVNGGEDPCDECLHHPINDYSEKPVNFKPAEDTQSAK